MSLRDKKAAVFRGTALTSPATDHVDRLVVDGRQNSYG